MDGLAPDLCFEIPDEEWLPVLFDVQRRDGLALGSSAGVNVAGAMRVARALGPGHTVVTVLCDGGDRYRSKMYTASWLAEKGLTPRAAGGFGNVDFVQ